ncbi:MAG: hypothetical protein KDD48_05330 [Bdellovibrionales bacterium]|nr:hypothetical protein [Bdellovibrionales bacterium]
MAIYLKTRIFALVGILALTACDMSDGKKPDAISVSSVDSATKIASGCEYSLSWSASKDNITDAEKLKYTVYISDKSDAKEAMSSKNKAGFVMKKTELSIQTNVPPAKYVYVTATDEAGNESDFISGKALPECGYEPPKDPSLEQPPKKTESPSSPRSEPTRNDPGSTSAGNGQIPASPETQESTEFDVPVTTTTFAHKLDGVYKLEQTTDATIDCDDFMRSQESAITEIEDPQLDDNIELVHCEQNEQSVRCHNASDKSADAKGSINRDGSFAFIHEAKVPNGLIFFENDWSGITNTLNIELKEGIYKEIFSGTINPDRTIVGTVEIAMNITTDTNENLSCTISYPVKWTPSDNQCHAHDDDETNDEQKPPPPSPVSDVTYTVNDHYVTLSWPDNDLTYAIYSSPVKLNDAIRTKGTLEYRYVGGSTSEDGKKSATIYKPAYAKTFFVYLYAKDDYDQYSSPLELYFDTSLPTDLSEDFTLFVSNANSMNITQIRNSSFLNEIDKGKRYAWPQEIEPRVGSFVSKNETWVKNTHQLGQIVEYNYSLAPTENNPYALSLVRKTYTLPGKEPVTYTSSDANKIEFHDELLKDLSSRLKKIPHLQEYLNKIASHANIQSLLTLLNQTYINERNSSYVPTPSETTPSLKTIYARKMELLNKAYKQMKFVKANAKPFKTRATNIINSELIGDCSPYIKSELSRLLNNGSLVTGRTAYPGGYMAFPSMNKNEVFLYFPDFQMKDFPHRQYREIDILQTDYTNSSVKLGVPASDQVSNDYNPYSYHLAAPEMAIFGALGEYIWFTMDKEHIQYELDMLVAQDLRIFTASLSSQDDLNNKLFDYIHQILRLRSTASHYFAEDAANSCI